MASLPLVFSRFRSIFSCSWLLFWWGSGKAMGTIGVNYGRVANNLPSPEKVVELLKAQGLDRVKMFDADPTIMAPFCNSGIKLTVGLPNELLSSAAADQTFADDWVRSNISAHGTSIEAISVGNEVFVDPNNTTRFLVPAMKNIQTSLVKFNLSSTKVSSPIALSSLQVSYPPSSGSFRMELVEPVIKPMLEFLRQTESFLMVNAYPFFAYSGSSGEISLSYALFEENPGVVDSGNGLVYHNLFDAQLDAVNAAMAALGFGDVKLVVTETGWPSAGNEDEAGASKENAAKYVGNLVIRVFNSSGTPLKVLDPLNIYLFSLFNENQKPGPTSERNYGLFYPTEEKVYDVPLIGSHQSDPTVNDSKIPSNGDEDPASGNTGPAHTWCVANEMVSIGKLQDALDYACGEGGSDCRPIQIGSTCYHPNTLVAHASYAFNSYYQKNQRRAGSCHFNGSSHVTTRSPSFGKCQFPTGY